MRFLTPPVLEVQPEVFRLYSPSTRLYLQAQEGTCIRMVPDARRAGSWPSKAAANGVRRLVPIGRIRADLQVVPGTPLPA